MSPGGGDSPGVRPFSARRSDPAPIPGAPMERVGRIGACLLASPNSSSARCVRIPVDAEVASHRLLVRAGYIRRQAAGIFAWLPLGLKVRRKIEADHPRGDGGRRCAGGALSRAAAARALRGDGSLGGVRRRLFRLQDRKGADYLLAPTHEEVFTLLVKDLYSSYKDLPLSIYQIQDKYRDEARPRAGLLRGREFTMKDAYSFDYTDAGLDLSYQKQRDAYERIFTRLGLDYVIVAGGLRARWAGRAARSSCTPPTSAKTPSCARPAATRPTSRRSRRLRPAARSYEKLTPAEVLSTPGHPHHRDARRGREREAPAAGWSCLDRGRHPQEHRARADAPRRHSRDRRRRHARRPRAST